MVKSSPTPDLGKRQHPDPKQAFLDARKFYKQLAVSFKTNPVFLPRALSFKPHPASRQPSSSAIPDVVFRSAEPGVKMHVVVTGYMCLWCKGHLRPFPTSDQLKEHLESCHDLLTFTITNSLIRDRILIDVTLRKDPPKTPSNSHDALFRKFTFESTLVDTRAAHRPRIPRKRKVPIHVVLQRRLHPNWIFDDGNDVIFGSSHVPKPANSRRDTLTPNPLQSPSSDLPTPVSAPPPLTPPPTPPRPPPPPPPRPPLSLANKRRGSEKSPATSSIAPSPAPVSPSLKLKPLHSRSSHPANGVAGPSVSVRPPSSLRAKNPDVPIDDENKLFKSDVKSNDSGQAARPSSSGRPSSKGKVIKPVGKPAFSSLRKACEERKLFHTVWQNTMHPDALEILSDSDTEDAVERDWRLTVQKDEIISYNDTRPSEKLFMNLWNQFVVGEFKVDRDSRMSPACREFVSKYHKILTKMQLEIAFVRHLSEMSRIGLIDSDDMYWCITQLRDREKSAEGEEMPHFKFAEEALKKAARLSK